MFSMLDFFLKKKKKTFCGQENYLFFSVELDALKPNCKLIVF